MKSKIEQDINSIMKILFRNTRIFTFLLTLLLLGSVANQTWATNVTYHILTLPIDNGIYHMKAAISGKRLEAFKITVNGQSTLELPVAYKSPLATGFTYYEASDVTKSGSAVKLFDATNNTNKGYTYDIKGGATPVAEGTTLSGSTADYYVVYTYNSSNTIAQLNGSVKYNIKTIGYDDKGKETEKGFIAYNRGRNNRPAVLPKTKVDAGKLASEDFVKVDVTGTSVSSYWKDNNNKNKEAITGSKFHFIFKFEGVDPYNIIIRTAYDRDTTYIEKNDNINPAEFVYKYYKEGSLFSNGTANTYFASDEHRHYNYIYNSALSDNPTNLTEGVGTGWDARTGFYHGQNGTIWNSFALLNNSKSTGYVFMGTRTVNGNGVTPDSPYYLKEANTCNNLVTNQVTVDNATNNLTIEGLYPIKDVAFKVCTPFYEVSQTEDHIVTATSKISQYTIDNDAIDVSFIPEELKRKYCNFTGKFYRDAAHTVEITKYNEAEIVDGKYVIYVDYNIQDTPFQAITPKSSYTAAELNAASWYELTDAGSTEINGKKIKYDTSIFKNDGASGSYDKTSEFAFIGDPYELRVILRSTTTAAGSPVGPHYVGAASPGNLGVSDSDGDGYKWEIPYDTPTGSFLLKKYKGSGIWYWDAGEAASTTINYATKAHSYNVPTANAQDITINVTGLTYAEGSYITVTKGGTDQDQVTVPEGKVYVQPGGTATFTAAVKYRGDSNKQFTLSIQLFEYNSETKEYEASGSPSVLTINQNTDATTSSPVQYSTSASTRVKVLALPKMTFTYNIVDKSGRIAAKASINQTIYMPLSTTVSQTLESSLPAVIISPFLVGETLTFYDDAYVDNSGRGSLTNSITETPNEDHDIFVTYTTEHLSEKPIKLNEEQEFNVVLNGEYIYYDAVSNTINSKQNPTGSEKGTNAFLWKLRNRDPYNMLIDNLGAREDLGVTGSENVTVYDDNGVSVQADGTTPATLDPDTRPERQKGAWVKLADVLGNNVALTFDTDRTQAQQFIAKSGLQGSIYEVMVAAGEGVDASTTYYNIGRTSTTEIKIYDNATYAHGNDVLKFQLEQTIDYKYHLIDKSNHELLEETSQSPDLVLPAEYQSPLVSEYHYYDIDQFTITAGVYTLKDGATPLASINDLDATFTGPEAGSYASAYDAADSDHKHADATSVDDINAKAKKLTKPGNHYYKISDTYYLVTVSKVLYNDIYVTYDVNDRVKFNDSSSPYMLKFLQPNYYYLEDGNDKLTTEKIQAVYPYCNGDASLNIYSDDMQKEQFNGGANTRPRWTWFFESDNKDPYHVMIHSSNTIPYDDKRHANYLQTYAVKYYQDDPSSTTKHIVTCGALPTVGSEKPTEYMILGTDGQFRLKTTELFNDGTSNMRRDIKSLEQYWKTYDMIKKFVWGIEVNNDEAHGGKYKDIDSDDKKDYVVPDDELRGQLQTRLEELRVGIGQWHSYDTYTYAVRWNGYDNDNSHGTKTAEKLEHWYQTFDMGNGTFDIESASIPPVLILLDRHGWEIMRQPLPSNYPYGEKELAALRKYDSPLVKEYKFYSNATKITGCHKYTLRIQNKAERDQIKVGDKQYTSQSLGDLPPLSATGVLSNGLLNDQYVTYTVKEEYEDNYDYTLTLNKEKTTYTETGVSQPYFVLQAGRFYKTENNADKSYISKPIYEHTKTNTGNIFDLIVEPKNHGGTNANIVDGSGNWIGNTLWRVMPNLDIDDEMGFNWSTENDTTKTEPLSKYGTRVKYEKRTGFDPYNIQLQLMNNNNGSECNKFLTTHMTSANLDNGIMTGDYSGSGGTLMITLEDRRDATATDPEDTNLVHGDGYDHSTLNITNQTFMVVSDDKGNMQLMPRFDHTLRVNLDKNSPWYTQLSEPEDQNEKVSADDNASMGPQTTFFVRPQRFHYHIIDNLGREALRYVRAADFYPAITEHFKSPLAKDFTYYTGLAEHKDVNNSTAEEWGAASADFQRTVTTETRMNTLINLLPMSGIYYYKIGTEAPFTYKKVEVTKGLDEKEITGSFAATGAYKTESTSDTDEHVYVRYNYDETSDLDGDNILQGQWFTVQLAAKDLVADGTIATEDDPETEGTDETGTGVSLFKGDSKPSPITATDKTWQWKFLQAPADPSSDYYEAPDPYAVQIFNRRANYTDNPTTEHSPMSIGIKVPNANDGADRFALLSHPNGGYAMVVAKTYDSYDNGYNYPFINGASMTTSVAATTENEASFTYKTGIITNGAKIDLNNDVVYSYNYRVINNSNKWAVSADQSNEEALTNKFIPYLPEAAQTPLLNMEDYKYYGFSTVDDNGTVDTGDDTYTVIPQTLLYTLYGLYDDIVWVRYGDYNVDKTEFKIPNEKTIVDGHVARGDGSHDVAMNINGELPYNIFWYNDNIMSTSSEESTAITSETGHVLSGDHIYVWYFEGGDPYALKIRHKESSNYVNGTGTLVADAASAMQFMLLKKDGYDYGILQKTGDSKKFTIGDDSSTPLITETFYMTESDPTKFVIFGLSVHDLIYRLIIAKTCTKEEETDQSLNPSKYVDIPFREVKSGTLKSKRIFGSTQRDLTSVNTGEGTHYAGEKYQLGETIEWGSPSTGHTYSFDAGTVSIGDKLEVPNAFNRPNCTFKYYIEGIYDTAGTASVTALDDKYKGLERTHLMSDADLIDKTVVVNIVYSFDETLATNNGLDFVRSTDQNLWYTFETQQASTPWLARYTNTQKLTTISGRDTRYTNDYLFTPVGDVYGFKMYNRYTVKNSNIANDNDLSKVMTTTTLAADSLLDIAVPPADSGYEVYELMTGDVDGFFRVHPVVNNTNPTLYVNISDNKLKLSTTPRDWTYGLDLAMLQPYYLGAGNVGGLTTTPKAGQAKSGKQLYEEALEDPEFKITDLQAVVYDDKNIVDFSTGYYRLHSQPGIPGISPVRYASGYLHEIEKTAESGGIPMHFYSKSGVDGTFNGDTNPLGTGFTTTAATRGDIPIPSTETDPSTIFYVTGSLETYNRTISNVTMSTQGLNVIGNKMGTGTATTYRMIDIGGGIVILVNVDSGNYLNFTQTDKDNIYDLKYSAVDKGRVDDVKWCMEPANTMGLTVATNKGGDDYYYSTFCAPFDVLLPDDVSTTKKYYAYICDKWDDKNLHPTKVPEVTGTPAYAEGKFVPAGTPVIFRILDESGSMKLTLPNNATSSSSLTGNIFSGKYLEQLLDVDGTHDVYTLGLPYNSGISKDDDYSSTGDIIATPPMDKAKSGVGFYINANPNKENHETKAQWYRNNRYVLHNKIYYLEGATSGINSMSKGPEYVPLIFDFNEEFEEEEEMMVQPRTTTPDDDKVYDLHGRCIATGDEVLDGSWKNNVAPGLYIIGGKKIYVGN